MTAHIRRKTPEKKQAKQHTRGADAAGQTQRIDPLRLAQYRQEAGQAWQAMKATYLLRLDTPQAWKEWQAAVYHQYEVYKKYDDVGLQSQPLSDVATRYNWDLWRDMELLRGGDRTKLEVVITFLEADLYFDRSGYVKEKIIRYIKLPMLTPQHVARLQAVVLAIVDKRDGREFRDYCRLARKVDSPELREQLRHRLTRAWPSARSLTDDLPALMLVAQQDRDIRRRARWVLEALGEKDTSNL